MKILLFKPGAIGDVIMTTPLIRQLRKNFQKAKIDYLIGYSCSQILENNPNLDKIIPFDENIFYKKKIIGWLKLIRKIRREKYDIIFALNKHKIYNLTAFLFKIPYRIGFNRFRDGLFLNYKVAYEGRKHEIFYYLDLLKGLKKEPNYSDWQPEINLTNQKINFSESFWQKNKLENKKVIGVCPGGGKNVKNQENLKIWPTDKYIRLIKKIKENGLEILLFGGKNDKKIEEEILKEVNCLSTIGKTNLKESAALLKKCQAVICNDSGPMHLTSTANDKILSLFGPTSPHQLAPLYKNSYWIWKSEVGCNPCYNLYGNFPDCQNKKCLKLISAEEVFNKLNRMINL